MEQQQTTYNTHNRYVFDANDEFSRLETVLYGIGTAVVSVPILVGAAIATAAHGANEAVQQSRRFFHWLEGEQTERVDSIDAIFPYYTVIK